MNVTIPKGFPGLRPARKSRQDARAPAKCYWDHSDLSQLSTRRWAGCLSKKAKALEEAQTIVTFCCQVPVMTLHASTDKSIQSRWAGNTWEGVQVFRVWQGEENINLKEPGVGKHREETQP